MYFGLDDGVQLSQPGLIGTCELFLVQVHGPSSRRYGQQSLAAAYIRGQTSPIPP